MSRKRKIVRFVLVVPVALLVALVLVATAAYAWSARMDRTNGSIVSSGITRRYLLYVPKSYDPSKPTPLVISIHPAATWAAVEANVSGWNELAERDGFIVVYPNGGDPFFDRFGPGPHVFTMEKVTLPRDVKFISELIDKLETEYHIDPDRIYANGMSNGGAMAFALSCKLAGRIAAVGVVAPAIQQSRGGCESASTPPMIAFHGTADRLAPYYGGSSPIAPFPFASIPQWTAAVAERNHCKMNREDGAVSASIRRVTYTDCAGHGDVVLYTIEGGGHTWPGGKHLAEWLAGPTTNEINATKLTWEFFQQHPHQRQ